MLRRIHRLAEDGDSGPPTGMSMLLRLRVLGVRMTRHQSQVTLFGQ